MRQLHQNEVDTVKAFFNANRSECRFCRYLANIQGHSQCGMLHFDCIVTVPMCLEVK